MPTVRSSSQDSSPNRPNILVIMSDQHNARYMGCAGDGVARTPAIDALAARGARFTAAYTPSPLCVPARMSFLTSRFPTDQQVWTNSCILDSNIPSFAHALGAAGYRTALAGRMHFYGHDQFHGFAERLVGDVSSAFPGTPGIDLGSIAKTAVGQTRPAVTVAGPGYTAYQEYDRQVAGAAAEYLNRPHDQPFCLVAGFWQPHCPFICPPDLFGYYHERVTMPAIPEGYFDTVHPFIRQWREHRGLTDLTPEEIRTARAGYYGMIELLDRNIATVLDGLARSGHDRDTLVIYTSDHGDMAGEHGLWWKSIFYEGSAGVPLIAAGPGVTARGTVSAVANLMDLGPTFIDLAGAAALPAARGRSLRGFLDGQGVADWPDETVSEIHSLHGDPPGRMIRSGPWKLNHYHKHAEPQLFNLVEDPGEWNDRAADPGCQGIRDRLMARVREGWNADRMERSIAAVMRDIPPIAAWGRAVRPESPHVWQAPEGANRFPAED